MECEIFRLETVYRSVCAASVGAIKPFIGRQIENERQIRPRGADRDGFQRENESWIEIAERALIGASRIRKAIADDYCALRERGPDRLVEMVDAGRREDNRLRSRTQRRDCARKQDVAQAFGAGRSAWFTGQQRVVAEAREAIAQDARLRGLAAALAAFQRDEIAVPAGLARRP